MISRNEKRPGFDIINKTSGAYPESLSKRARVRGKSRGAGDNCPYVPCDLTVHKAEGSQARRVIMFGERFPKMDDDMWRRWLYTGVTRAEEELCLFG